MNKNIDDRPALVYVICGQTAHIIKKSINLRLGQTDIPVLLNGKLFFQFLFLRFPLIQPLRQHGDGLPLFDGSPKIFDGDVGLLNSLFQCFHRIAVGTFTAFFRNSFCNKRHVFLGQQGQTFCHDTVFD